MAAAAGGDSHGRGLGLLLLVAFCVQCCHGSCPVGMTNAKICSGYGKCTPQNQCVCDSRHTGFDCSQHLCPLGNAWVAPAQATDVAHYPVECSNKGICDRSSGVCQCMEGFTGTACQRMACSDSCNDAGECLSLKQLSQVYAVATEPIYDSIWDADMIYGCKCRKGFHGFDCSKRTCPRGDDPMTTGQVNEVQIIQCTGTGGSFFLFFDGVGTTVPFDASIATFQQALHKIPNFPIVKVTYSAGANTALCNPTGINAVLIEFTQEFKVQPAIKVFKTLRGITTLTGGIVVAGNGGTVVAGKASIKPTKEWAMCSNRGSCDEASGQCGCYISPMPGYRSSDGYGNPGLRGDCGCANNQNLYGGVIASCVGELACSGHGYCSGSPSYKCNCELGWTSGDCSWRTCPQGLSWFAVPTSANVVHTQLATCSNAGLCDAALGECKCYSPFTGDACELMKCAGDVECNGHGRCMGIRELSLEADVDYPSQVFDYGADPNNAATYDSGTVLGCKCDPGYEGYDCSQRSCPRGDDPVTMYQVDEIKLIKCIASGGYFQLLYRMLSPLSVPFDTSPTVLRTLLMTAFGFEDVDVEYSTGQKACSLSTDTTQNVITLTFEVDHGDLPAFRVITTSLTGTPSVIFGENGGTIDGFVSQTGTKENAVCSNKGYCNYDDGTCQCLNGFGSSDGRGSYGGRNDCGTLTPARTRAILSNSPKRQVTSLTQTHSERSLHRDSIVAVSPTTKSSSAASSASPKGKRSAKLDRALRVKEQCEHDLEKFFASKRRETRPPASPRLFDDSYASDQDSAYDRALRDKRLVERLLRKISPSLKNTAATHSELVSMLQSCPDCRMRVTFCGSCARKAMAFFSGYTKAELQAIYAQDLPPANEEQVDAFAEAMAYRAFLATHESPTGRE